MPSTSYHRDSSGSGRAAESLARVAHVTFDLDVGGQEKLLVEFAKHADRTRFDLRFLSIGGRGALGGDIEGEGWPVETFGAPTGLHPGLIPRLAASFRRRRPAVVHTHDMRALFYAAPAARLARVPWVVHSRHGLDVHATRRQVFVFRQLSRLVDRFVCVSEEVAALSRAQGVAPGRIRTVLNGIDLDRFRFVGPDPAGPVVTVARLSPEKDIANLVRAVAITAGRAPNLRVEVAGGGPCLEDLDRLADELGVADRIAFLGNIQDVSAVLRRARLFVLSSRSEGIPLSVLEAMARGLPVVATRVGGLPEVVVDGVTGRLVPPEEPCAMSEAILGIWDRPEKGIRMGRAGRERVEQHFEVRRMVAEYESLYLEPLSRRNKARLVTSPE